MVVDTDGDAAMKRAVTSVLVAAALLSLGGVARAESDPVTTQEMLRELRALAAEAEAFRVALAEAAQYDRLRSEALKRAMAAADGDLPATADNSDAPRTAPSAEVTLDDAGKAKSPRKPARHRKKAPRPITANK
jgi:hypothetical protein